MRSHSQLIASTAAALCCLNVCLAAVADTRIRGEFDYNVADGELSQWQIGPAFELDDATELEIPIGQDDSLWFISPELTYEIETSDFLTIELSVGIEASFSDNPIEGFGSLEGTIDF